MVNIKVRLIIFFAAHDGEVLYNQQKQEQELTMTQIVKFLLKNSDLKKKKEKFRLKLKEVGKTTRPFR